MTHIINIFWLKETKAFLLAWKIILKITTLAEDNLNDNYDKNLTNQIKEVCLFDQNNLIKKMFATGINDYVDIYDEITNLNLGDRANKIENDQIIPFEVQMNSLKEDPTFQLLKLESKAPNYKKNNTIKYTILS